MVPAAVVVLEKLPLTRHGKVDRKALPAPEFTCSDDQQGPRTPRERMLAGLFAEVLGAGTVGIDDSFFDLGGDSIVSIQLVSRARRAGVVITPRDVFTLRTVAALAAAARDVDTVVVEDATAGIGPVPATPIVRALAETGGPVDGFYQSMVVVTPATLTWDELLTAVNALLERHDALRLRMTRDAEQWTLNVPPATTTGAQERVHRVTVRNTEPGDWHQVVEHETRAAQSRLAPESGAMLDVVWFDAGPGTPGRLLVMVHHLAVDGVSWRILLPDLQAAQEAAAAGHHPALEPVPTSLRTWAHALTRSANDPSRTAELPLWQTILNEPEPLLGSRTLNPARDTISTSRVVQTCCQQKSWGLC